MKGEADNPDAVRQDLLGFSVVLVDLPNHGHFKAGLS
jgi:hypothetical protein